MTTEDDFQAVLDANPDDGQTRQVFADWLQERNDPRAEGYRALGINRFYPRGSKGTLWRWDSSLEGTAHAPLPEDWRVQIESRTAYTEEWRTRRAAEDAAARAFALLPPKRRTELLAATPADS